MRISANDIKSGNILDYEGELWVVSKTPEHTKPGKGGAYVQVEMKNLRTGNKLNQRFSSSESVEKAFLERKEMQYLYDTGDALAFMDVETYDQIEIQKDKLEWELNFLKPNDTVNITSYNSEILGLILPDKVSLTITETEPAVKGDTATNAQKNAILETGLQIRVPMFIEQDEVVLISTSDGKYAGRA